MTSRQPPRSSPQQSISHSGMSGPSSPASAAGKPASGALMDEHGRNFVSALFMALRTAQIHSTSNQAFENALRTLLSATDVLFAAAGPFSIQFVDESVYLNRVRLKFDGGSFGTLGVLRAILESEDLGGLTITQRPTYASIRTLLVLFTNASSGPRATKEDFHALGIQLLGPQRFDDGAAPQADSGVFALQCYAKLILALREQHERIASSEASSAVPQLRAIRVVQDLVELASERPDLVARLAMNTRGGEPHELLGANACLLSIVMAQALHLSRPELMDVAIGALFHRLGNQSELGRDAGRAALAHVLSQSTVGLSLYRRALVIAEHRESIVERGVHPFARLVAVAVAFSELLGGFGTESSRPLDIGAAVTMLYRDPTGRFDPAMVDLLINVLRVFPPGVEVVLEDGSRAGVIAQSTRGVWDRPEVVLLDGSRQRADLMQTSGSGYARTIAYTVAHTGRAPKLKPDWLRAFGGSRTIPPMPTPPPPPPTRQVRVEAAVGLPAAVDDQPVMLSAADLIMLSQDLPKPSAPSFPEIQIQDPEELIPEVRPEHLQPGTILGDRYRVMEKIAEGGMATIYKVEHTLLLKPMALKLLKTELTLIPGLAQRFLREARSVCRLDDPNIVRVTDFGRAENVGLFLVMELVDGLSLAQMLRHGEPLSIARIFDILDQILSGLAHAHDNQIVHRDMKPDNVMLIRRGDSWLAKVLDFGIAKGRDADEEATSLTRPGTVFGTPAYMSPEQALGENTDFRTDLYSTGVVLYELIAGAPPFQDPSPMKLFSKMITDPPPLIDLSMYGDAFADTFAGVLDGALAKEPGERFPSANAFRNALRTCLQLLPPQLAALPPRR